MVESEGIFDALHILLLAIQRADSVTLAALERRMDELGLSDRATRELRRLLRHVSRNGV